MRKVVILGAGATQAGISNSFESRVPLDKDFFEALPYIKERCTPILTDRVLKQVFALYGRTYGVSLENYFRDLESRQIIGSVSKAKGKPKGWPKKILDLRELIRRGFIQTTCSFDKKLNRYTPRSSNLHKNVLENLTRGDAVVTFNYDLVIEESFDKVNHKQWNPRYGYGKSVTIANFKKDWARRWIKALTRLNKGERKRYSFPQCNVVLLKLHGSLNWRVHKQSKRIDLIDNPFLVETRKGEPRPENVSIIPPGILKDITDKPYSQLWQEARRYLDNCRELIIVGYSLPETDFLAHSLFNEVVRFRSKGKNVKKLLALHLADKDPLVRKKYVDIFSPLIGANGRIYEYEDFNKYTTSNSQN